MRLLVKKKVRGEAAPAPRVENPVGIQAGFSARVAENSLPTTRLLVTESVLDEVTVDLAFVERI